MLACVVGGGGELVRQPEGRVPNYRFPEAAVGALALAADRREWLSRPLGQAPQVDGIDVQAARALAAGAGEGPLGPDETRALLEAFGIDAKAGAPARLAVDSDLGPLIAVGDAYRLAPLTDVDVQELAPDAPAVRDAVARLAALIAAVPEVVEVVLDPLSITLGPAPNRQHAKTW